VTWHGLFAFLAILTVLCALLTYCVVPDAVSPTPGPKGSALHSLKTVYSDPRFWQLAPVSPTCGTAFALQGLWVSSWLTDVDGVARSTVVTQLFIMALVQSVGAFLIGIGVDRRRQYGIRTQTIFALGAFALIVAQTSLVLRLAIPSFLVWSADAIVGGTSVLSFVALAEYFPKEIAGRANAALAIFHIGGAFTLQYAIGLIVQLWPSEQGHYPAIAYQTAFAFDVALQIAALIWFVVPRSCYAAESFELGKA
jgi:predicted MFS family arabinose efflux permease